MTSTTSPYLLRDGALTKVVSEVTGRTLGVNPDRNRFVLLAGWHPEALAAVRTELEQLVHQSKDMGPAVRALAHGLLAATGREALADELESRIADLRRYMATKGRARGTSTTKRAAPPDCHASRASVSVLILMWKHGLLLGPRDEVGAVQHFGRGSLTRVPPDHWGPGEHLRAGVRDILLNPKSGGVVAGLLGRILLAIQGVEEVGDLDFTVLREFARPLQGQRKGGTHAVQHYGGTLLDALHLLQTRTYAGDEALRARVEQARVLRDILPGKGAKEAHPNRSDPEFGWVTVRYPQHEGWRVAATRYLATVENRVDLVGEIRSLTRSLDLLGDPAIPTTPLAFCARTYDGAARLRAYLETLPVGAGRVADVHRAAERLLDSVLAAEAQLPGGGTDPSYHNPATGLKLPHRRRKGQTHREAMPPWLMQEMRDLLSTDEWARTLTDDEFTHVDPASGRSVKVWAPVRLEMARLRLMLPLRTLQARLLDSGEGDSEVWDADLGDPLKGRWAPNAGRWAPHDGGQRQLGVLRPIYDAASARQITGLYVSTNKTADRDSGFLGNGYEIPWENADIIALVLRLRAWQARYNPSRGPQKRTAATSTKTREKRASPDVEAILPAHHYLFRDPKLGDGQKPVTSARARSFWHAALAEVERRLNERVRRGDPTARPTQLIAKRGKSGRPQRVRFDLHSLRVSGLTELAMNGCPIHVLMHLAGHATWVMTLYYVKPSPSDISRELDAARERAAEAVDATTWEELTTSGALEALRALPLANSDAANEHAAAYAREMWRQMDYGECPCGGTLCHVGGDVLSLNHRDGHQYGPVLGGMRNCTACRFFRTTPAHLLGLIARFNALSYEARETAGVRRRAEKARRELVAAARAAPESAALRARLARADAAVEEAAAAEDLLMVGWGTTLSLITRCKAALQQEMAERAADALTDGRRLPVILGGTVADFAVALEQCSEYDFETRLLEDVVLWPSNEPTAAKAALRSGVRIDRILADVGAPAVLSTLDEDERRVVILLWAQWLHTKLGPVDREAIARGEKTLRDFGLLEESDRLLAPYRTVVHPGDVLAARRGRPALTAGPIPSGD